MRTTVDLPDDLLMRAKVAAVLRGTTLRELVAAGLEKEIAAGPNVPKGKGMKRPVPVTLGGLDWKFPFHSNAELFESIDRETD